MDKDPGNLVKKFVEDLLERQGKIAKEVKSLYKLPGCEEEERCGQWFFVEKVHLPKKVKNLWKTWAEQVPVFGFNSGRYDINMIKEYREKSCRNFKRECDQKRKFLHVSLTAAI